MEQLEDDEALLPAAAIAGGLACEDSLRVEAAVAVEGLCVSCSCCGDCCGCCCWCGLEDMNLGQGRRDHGLPHFFLLSVRQFRLKEPSGPARGSLFTVLKRQTVSPRLRRPRDYYSLRVQSLRCRLKEQSSQSANYDFLPGSLSRRVPCRPRFLFLSLSFLRRSSRHPLYAAAPLPPPPPLSRATGREERDGTSERGERNGREGREDRGRAAGGAPA